MANYKYDVFISYSSKDRAWIKKNLLPKLTQKGIKYCVDFRDFAAGKSAMYNMRDAVNKSRQTLLVMTPNWVKSEWTAFESLLVRGKDPTGIRQRTIPLLVKKCKVDDILSTLTWVNLAQGGSKAIAWNQLYTALGKRPAPKQPRQIRNKRNANWHLAHPYPMSPNFTGRITERNMLSQWLNEDKGHPLLVLRALGGFGKSALSWYWLTHDVDSTHWTKVVYWSFYEGDANFEDFLKETLAYLGFSGPERINPREQTDILLKLLHNPGILLIMDGFERALRAYGNMGAAYQADELQGGNNDIRDSSRDCISPFAEGFLRYLSAYGSFIHSKVLMTTRLTPRAVEHHGHVLEGCLERELRAMDKDDAVNFFRSEGIRGTHAEIEEACSHYGFHPLSLRLLAGLIVSDLQAPGDIAVAKRLDISNDIVQNKHHVLEKAFETMPKERQKLLSQLACFRSPVTYDDLKSVATIDAGSKTGKKSRSKTKSQGAKSKEPKTQKIVLYPDFDNDLRDLLARGLLHHDSKTNKYDLHPIVRRYAYDRLTAADRTGAHERLVNYFEAVPKPEKVKVLEDLAPVIELYHHMVRAGKLDDAVSLFNFRLKSPLYFQMGAYQVIIQLLEALPLLDTNRFYSKSNHATMVDFLAASYGGMGNPRKSIQTHMFAEEVWQSEDESALAYSLTSLADEQLKIGALRDAERSMRRQIDLCREIEDEGYEAMGHRRLGYILSYRGAWQEAEQELNDAIAIQREIKHIQSLGVTSAYRALRFLLMTREQFSVGSNPLAVGDVKSAIESAGRALELVEEDARTSYPVPHDYVHAYRLLGAAYRANGELDKAEENLSKAISMCRPINLVAVEADILLELAKLSYARSDFKDAREKAEEALTITERCGYVLQGADVNLFLAELALAECREGGVESSGARTYAQEALRLATCDGPPYYYKVAYEEAERLLEKLK